jgi:uncharacterized RmlC-like cupin family protein
VTLSNGTALDLSDTIGDTFTDVQRVLYVLHGPAGTWVTGVVSTAGPIGPKEAFYYIPDGAPDQYAVVSKVTTSSSGINVVASATVTTILDTASASDSGWNNQQLKISLSP